jgi:glycosyltransferase involved in cell wall biosynthesis
VGSPTLCGMERPVCFAHDTELLAKNILRVIWEPALATALVRVARSTADTFAWEAVGPKWIDLYRCVRNDKITMETHSS